MSFDSWFRFIFWLVVLWGAAGALRTLATGRARTDGGVILAAEHPGEYRFELTLRILSPLLLAALLVATGRNPEIAGRSINFVAPVVLFEPLARALRTGCWDHYFGEPIERRERPIRYWIETGAVAALVAAAAIYAFTG